MKNQRNGRELVRITINRVGRIENKQKIARLVGEESSQETRRSLVDWLIEELCRLKTNARLYWSRDGAIKKEENKKKSISHRYVVNITSYVTLSINDCFFRESLVCHQEKSKKRKTAYQAFCSIAADNTKQK